MTESEYEQRKLELEARLQISIQFLQKGYEAQLGALELERAREERAAAPAPEAAAPAQRRRAPGDLLEQIRERLAQLPAEFTKEDIVRFLGFTPDRSSLHRALDELLGEREVRLHVRGAGRTPNVYRKVGDVPKSL